MFSKPEPIGSTGAQHIAPGRVKSSRPRHISVVGTIGSDKITVAREISRRLHNPHFELDSVHWEVNWVEAPDPVFQERVKQALGNNSCVVDRNYHQVRDIVWSRADTAVWLDYSFRIIVSRLARRTLRRVFIREKLWQGNLEHLRPLLSHDSVFWWAIKTYHKRRRKLGDR